MLKAVQIPFSSKAKIVELQELTKASEVRAYLFGDLTGNFLTDVGRLEFAGYVCSEELYREAVSGSTLKYQK